MNKICASASFYAIDSKETKNRPVGPVSLLLAGDVANEKAVRPDFVSGSMHPRIESQFLNRGCDEVILNPGFSTRRENDRKVTFFSVNVTFSHSTIIEKINQVYLSCYIHNSRERKTDIVLFVTC